jgi:hypothetical protein
MTFDWEECWNRRATPTPQADAAIAAGGAQEPNAWQPIETAPRDGTNILIRFGRDGVSQAKYVPGTPHPWKFIDTNDGITWIINHAVDTEYGPTHWMPMPDAAPRPHKAATAAMTGGWISVDERLPENDQVVAFVVMADQQSPNWYLNGHVLGGTYHENWGFSTPGVGHRASHWMPLPAAPAVSNGEQA